ncbi:MAG: polyprenyl synthetase family protein [Planctomycetes bacterium]|nr:polyprenyl synthetase family protein [Planctomycetota bacterium]
MSDTACIQELRPRVNTYLEACCKRHSQAGASGLLGEAMQYCLLGGGKRIRPILVLACCRTAGGQTATPTSHNNDDPSALAAGAALEMIHTFSLIHDDLPAMDDDDLRRNRPTCHVKFKSDAVAILAGDALATLPYLLIHREIQDRTLAGTLVTELSEATMKMILGQVYDTEGAFPADVTEPAARLTLLHEHKTGALIRCACRMGALVAGADQDTLDALTRYGQAIGLMFQVVDDILDETQTTEQMGKPTHKDADRDKLTYPTVHGLDASHALVTDLEQQACTALNHLPASCDTNHLLALANYFASRTR